MRKSKMMVNRLWVKELLFPPHPQRVSCHALEGLLLRGPHGGRRRNKAQFISSSGKEGSLQGGTSPASGREERTSRCLSPVPGRWCHGRCRRSSSWRRGRCCLRCRCCQGSIVFVRWWSYAGPSGGVWCWTWSSHGPVILGHLR